jgi:HlyD family secretion protein
MMRCDFVTRSIAPRLGCLILATLICGCEKPSESAPTANVKPRVHVVNAERRTIERTVAQPAFIEAFEQTSIFPKIAGYIQKWTCDIGDPIEKDQLLAELFIPELVAELQQRQAQAEEQEVLIRVAEEMVNVADNRLKVAVAGVAKANADVGQYESAVERWESEVDRLASLVAKRVVDRQVLEESQKQLKSNISARESATAAVVAAEALAMERKADLAKAQVDVEAARAKAKVAQAEVQRYLALSSYTKIRAPYDGSVVVRNANTGDFVQPASGDQSTGRDMAGPPSGKGTPIYVVARTDKVRVFVDIPEVDANNVANETPVHVHVPAMADADIKARVTRTSWSLNVQTRTLRAEIDLPNPKARLLPGMYAYATVVIQRSDVRAVPRATVTQLGNQNCCYLLDDGKAWKTPVQAGVSDGKWIEVVKKLTHGEWLPFTGKEEIIVGDLAEISDGEEVSVEPSQEN